MEMVNWSIGLGSGDSQMEVTSKKFFEQSLLILMDLKDWPK